MAATIQDIEQECRRLLRRYFSRCPNPELEKSAMKVLKFVMTSDQILRGDPAGWAGGIVYVLANRYRYPMGIPGLLNAQAEKFFEISMGRIKYRAARVNEIIEV